MSKPGLSFGLSLSKKPGASKPAPPKKKAAFGSFGGDSDDEERDAPKSSSAGKTEAIGELGGLDGQEPASPTTSRDAKKPKGKPAQPPTQPPSRKPKAGQATSALFGDLSGSLAARKNAEAAEELDSSIYDYDKVYDSFKPQRKKKPDGGDENTGEEARKPKYMSSLLAAASVRKRDQLIAEEKRIAREREAEGEEYAGKEKFVTEAYKRQQEENKRIEEEEKRREEEEARNNKTGGMNAFYKGLLNKGEERHREMVQAAEEKAKSGPDADAERGADGKDETAEEEDGAPEDKDSERARQIIESGGSVAMNEEGQVVDKRQLLKGGLNVDAKKAAQARKEREANRAREESRRAEGGPSRGGFVGSGGKGAMRERQTRMLEAQLEAALKRTRDDEQEEQEKVERANKSRKTEGEISSAKERYLARKRAAEEEKKKGKGVEG